ncbi:MAG: hydroxyethylthiazole kinase [Acidaminococcaceae bacterium]
MTLNTVEVQQVFARLKQQKPLVHQLTNYVTAGDCANIALCFGASPIMADAAEEMGEITSSADCLILNLGTLNAVKLSSMEIAALTARKNQIPVLIDPVGVMASNMRLQAALELITAGVSIVRGNYAECWTLYTQKRQGRGVDSVVPLKDIGGLALAAAQKYGCVFAITGQVDAISDGTQVLVLQNGHELLTRITGAGCMSTTLIGCVAGVTDNMFLAATCGLGTMNIAAEIAAAQLQSGEGPGTFKVRLLDAVAALTAENLLQKLVLKSE